VRFWGCMRQKTGVYLIQIEKNGLQNVTSKNPAKGEDPSKVEQQFVSALPHCVDLGMDLRAIGGGKAIMSVPYEERFVGDPATGVVHGGVITALLDSCAGAAVLSHESGKGGTATLDLRIDYMRSAVPGKRVYASAEVFHATRSVAFVRVLAYEEDPEKPIASGTASFTVGTRKPGKGQQS